MHANLQRLFVVLALVSCGRPEAPPSTLLSVVDDPGRAVSLPAPADRVFPAIPSPTGTIAAIDADVLVARTRFDRTPACAHEVLEWWRGRAGAEPADTAVVVGHGGPMGMLFHPVLPEGDPAAASVRLRRALPDPGRRRPIGAGALGPVRHAGARR